MDEMFKPILAFHVSAFSSTMFRLVCKAHISVQ